MKYLKIFLAILAAIGIGLAVYFGYTKTTTVEDIGRPENQFTRRVNQEIIDIYQAYIKKVNYKSKNF